MARLRKIAVGLSALCAIFLHHIFCVHEKCFALFLLSGAKKSVTLGSVTSSGSGCGGIVGNNFGMVVNCYSTNNVTGTEYIGGVAGISRGIIQKCYSTGSINGNIHIGGVAGNNSGVIQQCIALSPSIIGLTGSDTNFGRVVGSN